MSRLNLSSRGLRALRGPRFDVTARPPVTVKPPYPRQVWVDGKLLSVPHSRIYRALEQFKIPFETESKAGGGHVLGGIMVDFWLPTYRIALEYQGPFHNTEVGRARDIIRFANRGRLGARQVVEIFERDLDHIYDFLRNIVGYTVISTGVA